MDHLEHPVRTRPAEGPGRETGPTTVWLAVIPMIVLSVIGLTGGHSLPWGKASEPRRPLGAKNPAATTSTDDLGLQPASAKPDRLDRVDLPELSPTTSSTSATSSPSTASTSAFHPAPSATTRPPVGPATGCSAALEWLSAHSAPGFRFECPGYALGHQAMTCVDAAGVCPGERLIVIADPCPAAYMNEAHNSWILTGLAAGRLDPYGSCA